MSSDFKTLNSTSLPIESAKLHCPPLEEVARVLSDGLLSIFEKVLVEVCDCPNLEQPPFHLASEGINGKTSLIDVGGPPYLLPLVNKEKLYTFDKLNEICGNTDPAFFIGAGAGPFPYAGINCEMIANLKICGRDKKVKTRIAKMVNEEKGEFTVEELPNDETRFALLGNFFLSEGKPGKVVKISCRKRVGDENFITAIQNVLKNKYGSQPVGMGGVFLLTSGKVKQHIMPSFSQKPLNNEDDLNKWLRFFEMHAPLIAVGTLITEDPGLDLRLTHFHSFNTTSGEGGHYHYDTTPDVVEYTAYFTTAEYVYRVDKPVDSHQIGRD